MKTLSIALLSALLLSPSAWAQDAAGALDLSLPGTAAYSGDPPGTFYGDKTGPLPMKKAGVAEDTRDPCVVMHDDRDGDGVTGSVTTGIGYSMGHGRSTYNAANLNLCKSYIDDDGDTRTFNFNINVDRYDGPGHYGRGYGYPHGPGPRLRP